MLKLLRGWLRAGVFEGGIVSAIEAGTPQGSPLSPLLANIALHMLDEAWAGGGQRLGSAGQIRRRPGRPVRHPRAGRGGPRAGRGGSGRARVATAPREDEDRAPLTRRRGVRRSWASSIGCGSRGSSRVAGICRSGRPDERWPRSRQDPRPDRPPLRKAAAGVGGRGSQPRAAGLGGLLSLRQLRAKFSHIDGYVNERLAILASAKHGLTRPQLGHPLQPSMGHPARHPPPQRNGQTRRLRMPAGERCRRAVCGRTACTVRCGGGRRPRTSRHSRAVPGRLPPTLPDSKPWTRRTARRGSPRLAQIGWSNERCSVTPEVAGSSPVAPVSHSESDWARSRGLRPARIAEFVCASHGKPPRARETVTKTVTTWRGAMARDRP